MECPIHLQDDPFAPLRPRLWRRKDSVTWSPETHQWLLAEGCSGRIFAFDPRDESGLPSEFSRLPASLHAPWLEWAQAWQEAALRSGGFSAHTGAVEDIIAHGSGPILLMVLSYRTGAIAARLEPEVGLLTAFSPPEWWDPALGGVFAWWRDELMLVMHEGELRRWVRG